MSTGEAPVRLFGSRMERDELVREGLRLRGVEVAAVGDAAHDREPPGAGLEALRRGGHDDAHRALPRALHQVAIACGLRQSQRFSQRSRVAQRVEAGALVRGEGGDPLVGQALAIEQQPHLAEAHVGHVADRAARRCEQQTGEEREAPS